MNNLRTLEVHVRIRSLYYQGKVYTREELLDSHNNWYSDEGPFASVPSQKLFLCKPPILLTFTVKKRFF